MSQYNELPTKLEAACAAVVTAIGLTGVTVAAGMTGQTLSRPSIVCAVTDSAGEELKDSGLFRFRVGVIIKSSPDEGVDITVSKGRIGQVGDAFLDSDIASTLSSQVSDFYVYDVSFAGWQHSPEERDWTTTLELDVLCCGTDIT